MDNAENTEQKILHAAMNIFVKKGRYGAKMQEIADAAGINKAMLHYYFRSKDKLYSRVFENLFAGIFGSLHGIFEAEGTFPDKLTRFIEQYTSLISQNQQIPLFIMRELSEGAAEITPVIHKIFSENKFNLPFAFIQAIQSAIQKGEIRKVNPRQLFITIVGSVAFFFISEPLLSVFFKRDTSYQREAFIEERKKAVADIIFNGIKP
jgi:TetR/AcrR family transcriptional regulator